MQRSFGVSAMSDQIDDFLDGDAPGQGHNSGAGTQSFASKELRAFIERIERLMAEKADIAEAEKEVFAEAKGRGYDVKIMRKIIAERKRDKDDVNEEQAILELYRSALGM